MHFEATDVVKWFKKMNEKTNKHIDYLTDLDEQIGDGDHGINMARGFKAVIQKINETETEELNKVAKIMKDSAITLMTTVGGASGILYATAFLKMATVFQDRETVNASVFQTGLQHAVEGIKQRGNSNIGEKTLLDLWVAMAQLFSQSEQFPDPEVIESVARTTMEETKNLIAKKGKAALYEERSIGHIDPGAASTYYLFASLAETIKEKKYG